MGFYGNLTAPLKTKFEFDRIYSSKVVMDAKANEDEVFVGRFVLVNYEHYDYLWVKDNEVYMDRNCTIKPKSNAFVIGQTFINGFTNSFLWCEEVGKFPRIGATATTINAEIALDDIYNFNLWLDTKSEYCKDFVIKRNYHQTVWQKVYNDQLGKQQYVLIADLGAGLATENYDGLMSKEDKRIMNSNSRIFNVNHMYSTLTQKQQKNIKDYDLTTIGGPSFNEELSFDLSTAVKMLHCMFVEKEWHLKLEGADIYSNGVKEWKVGDVIIFKGKEKVVKNNKDIFVWETWKLVNIYGSGKEDEWYKDPNNWIRITGECLVNTSNDGLMSKEDKVKLDGTPRLFNINSIYLDSELMQEELSIGINLERALELLNNWLSENADSLQIGDEIYFKTDEIQNKGSNITYKVWSHYR